MGVLVGGQQSPHDEFEKLTNLGFWVVVGKCGWEIFDSWFNSDLRMIK